MLLAGLHATPTGSGLMTTRCKTVRMAARLRSVLHASHASRTRSATGMSLRTVADPVSQSYSRRAAGNAIPCRTSAYGDTRHQMRRGADHVLPAGRGPPTASPAAHGCPHRSSPATARGTSGAATPAIPRSAARSACPPALSATNASRGPACFPAASSPAGWTPRFRLPPAPAAASRIASTSTGLMSSRTMIRYL